MRAHHFAAIALLALLALGAVMHPVSIDSSPPKAKSSFAADLAAIRSISEQFEPRLRGETDPMRIALLLRNMIAWHTPGPDGWVTSTGYDWFDLVGTYRKSLLDPRYGHMCGGRVIIYLSALRAYGIPARKVGMYPAVDNLSNMATSHASAEVLLDGRWIAMDPHFNLSLRDSHGQPVGWLEAAEILAAGGSVAVEHDGFHETPANSLARYFRTSGITLAAMTRYMNTGPYRYNDGSRPATKRPHFWDGVLRYESGKIFNAFEADASHVYRLLVN